MSDDFGSNILAYLVLCFHIFTNHLIIKSFYFSRERRIILRLIIISTTIIFFARRFYFAICGSTILYTILSCECTFKNDTINRTLFLLRVISLITIFMIGTPSQPKRELTNHVSPLISHFMSGKNLTEAMSGKSLCKRHLGHFDLKSRVHQNENEAKVKVRCHVLNLDFG